MSKRIGIFLSSHDDLPASFEATAHQVGEWMGQHHHTLVYGGARKGLMEVLAQTTKANGGQVIGVVPQILVKNNLVSDTLDVTIHCADLNDRKAIMVRESDIFIALPGGIGTLDEIFTILAANTIGIENKHVILFNVNGCWNPTMMVLNEMKTLNLVNDEALAFVHLVESTQDIDEVMKLL